MGCGNSAIKAQLESRETAYKEERDTFEIQKKDLAKQLAKLKQDRLDFDKQKKILEQEYARFQNFQQVLVYQKSS